jgi:hypothetical protein
MYIIVTDFLVVIFFFYFFFLSIVSILVTQLIMVISSISIYYLPRICRSNLVHLSQSCSIGMYTYVFLFIWNTVLGQTVDDYVTYL